MAVCNICGHFCPDDEGARYCGYCLSAYLEKVEGLVKAARQLVDSQIPCSPPRSASRASNIVGIHFKIVNRIEVILDSLESHHDQKQ